MPTVTVTRNGRDAPSSSLKQQLIPSKVPARTPPPGKWRTLTETVSDLGGDSVGNRSKERTHRQPCAAVSGAREPR